jgi:hypothetical protein
MVDHESSRAAVTHDFGQFQPWADQLAELRDEIGAGTVTDDGYGRPILEFGDTFRYIQHDGSTPGQVTFGWLRTDAHDRVVIITKTMPAQMAVATARTLIANPAGALA